MPWRDDAWLRRMVDEGRTGPEMAAIAGCCPSTIYYALRGMSLPTDRRSRRSLAASLVPALAQCNHGEQPWRDPDWLRAMRAQGLSYRQMAQVAGCTHVTIVKAMADAGLSGKPSVGAPVETPRQRPRTDPVCDPDLCPGWEDCLDDPDAPCAWALLANSVFVEYSNSDEQAQQMASKGEQRGRSWMSGG